MKLADFVSDPQCVLKVLDVSANNFSEDSYEILKNGFFKNISLSKMEIRECKFKNRKNNPHFFIKKIDLNLDFACGEIQPNIQEI